MGDGLERVEQDGSDKRQPLFDKTGALHNCEFWTYFGIGFGTQILFGTIITVLLMGRHLNLAEVRFLSIVLSAPFAALCASVLLGMPDTLAEFVAIVQMAVISAGFARRCRRLKCITQESMILLVVTYLGVNFLSIMFLPYLIGIGVAG